MPPLPQARPGARLKVRGRQVGFSFWPSKPAPAHHALQSLLFSLDPWAVIKRSIVKNCSRARVKEALATLQQAQDFFSAGTERGFESARPLALYYSYMNLVKALCLTRGAPTTFDQAQHGLSEQISPNGKELTDAFLNAFPSPNGNKLQNFDELKFVLTGSHLAANARYDLPHLMPQILSGHRLWSLAANKRERFISTQDVQFTYDKDTNDLWLRVYFFFEDLTRLGVTHQKLLKEGGLAGVFREVQTKEEVDGRRLICFEQIAVTNCANGYPADYILSVAASVKHVLWATVSTVPPYRRYYVYLSPPKEVGSRMTQLLSMYAVMYYLGSITRYRPHHFEALVKGPYGPRIQDFVTGQPLQFLYLITSEFAHQDVTKPSIL
ncbi:YaaC family protein [Stappia sp.]|uniref:YaaC family protein n=1 Tax=Stappia sp. TaxID=1870903 RepID=UPI003A999261